jgi:hypothetical protein
MTPDAPNPTFPKFDTPEVMGGFLSRVSAKTAVPPITFKAVVICCGIAFLTLSPLAPIMGGFHLGTALVAAFLVYAGVTTLLASSRLGPSTSAQ